MLIVFETLQMFLSLSEDVRMLFFQNPEFFFSLFSTLKLGFFIPVLEKRGDIYFHLENKF